MILSRNLTLIYLVPISPFNYCIYWVSLTVKVLGMNEKLIMWHSSNGNRPNVPPKPV
jgi:hypothetical protein